MDEIEGDYNMSLFSELSSHSNGYGISSNSNGDMQLIFFSFFVCDVLRQWRAQVRGRIDMIVQASVCVLASD